MSKVKNVLATIGGAYIAYQVYTHSTELQQFANKAIPYAIKIAEYTVKKTVELIDKVI